MITAPYRRLVAQTAGLWSDADVYAQVWEYEMPGDRVAAFTTAYAADGVWGELFGRAAGADRHESRHRQRLAASNDGPLELAVRHEEARKVPGSSAAISAEDPSELEIHVLCRKPAG
jgi:hypothetical protein